VLELLNDAAPQFRTATRPAHAYAHGVELVAATADHVTIEAHEETHLIRRTPPVLRRERICRQVRYTQLDRPHDYIEEGVLPHLVALGTRQPALPGPPAVTVHDDGDVPGDQCLGQFRRSRSALVRIRRLYGPHAGFLLLIRFIRWRCRAAPR